MRRQKQIRHSSVVIALFQLLLLIMLELVRYSLATIIHMPINIIYIIEIMSFSQKRKF